MTSLETYLRQLRQERPAAVNETSFYGALKNLFDAVGDKLKPKIKYVITPRGQGAGIPDGGLYTATQLRRNAAASPASTLPERGCVEVKGPKEEVEKVAASEQVRKYLERYRLVLVTNYRDFLLVGVDEGGRRVNLERYTLAATEAEFWQAAERAHETAAEHAERFEEYVRRVLLHAAPLSKPEDVARFLASYARDAKVLVEKKKDLPALQSIRSAMEEALGMKFEGEKGEHFFRSTLVQTLFYGVFSAWVLWSQKQAREGRRERFHWREAAWTLRVPMISALFEQLLVPSRLQPLGLVDVLNWTEGVLNRIEDPAAFVEKFTAGHAVQYFYEPFLQEFDPELRKQLGVWYTPQEIVRYMVERVDTVLREELGVAEGLADEQVYVLDPCCGTGAYLVEVLRRIERTMQERGEGATTGAQLKQAAMSRVFGFEILPAPFVVAHLQLGLLLQTLDAPLAETGAERVAVFLTNALTGWEPPKEPKTRLLFPELEEERDLASKVKQKTPILVVLGNPPYNGFAGVAVAEERELTKPYRTTVNAPPPQGQGLNDLYIRFFRAAERRIVETGKGVVCFISNYSWLDGLSFTGMREHYLEVFDHIWIDNLNGDKYKTGKLTPAGEPDPSVFSTEYNREGIQVGTAVTLLTRREAHEPNGGVNFRNFWGKDKAEDLLNSSKEVSNHLYAQVTPSLKLGLPFIPLQVETGYFDWPLLTDLLPVTYPGVITARDDVVLDIDRIRLTKRMGAYFDQRVSHQEMSKIAPRAVEDAQRFNAIQTREYLQKRGFLPSNIVRYVYRPFDVRWIYWEPETKLLNEKRAEYYPLVEEGNFWLCATQQNRKEFDPPLVTERLAAFHSVERGANMFPQRLKATPRANLFDIHEDSDSTSHLNLSEKVQIYLKSIDLFEKADSLFFHIVSVLHAPEYRVENAGALRHDWPRVPLPGDAEALRRSAELGRGVAALLAYDPADPSTNSPLLRGVVNSPLRPEMRVLGTPTRAGGGQLKPSEGEYALDANWGFSTPKGVMPGRGSTQEREYADDERAAVAEGAAALGLTPEEAFRRLGEKTFDVYLNRAGYWRNVPARVWGYHIGGYQVIKKWLSYRERGVLGRDLSTAEVNEVRDMVRRIAALLLLEPALDENYDSAKRNAYAWPASA
ncbi:MAG: type ISP restriction/modification enzyme [Pyrinomonadaceae bacterium]